jgi:hypothetical protein
MLTLEAYLFGVGTGAAITVTGFAVATVRRLTKAKG